MVGLFKGVFFGLLQNPWLKSSRGHRGPSAVSKESHEPVSVLPAPTPETVVSFPFVTLAFSGQIDFPKSHLKKQNYFIFMYVITKIILLLLFGRLAREDRVRRTPLSLRLEKWTYTTWTVQLYTNWKDKIQKTSYPCQNTLCYTFKVHTNSSVVDQCKGK